MTLHCREWLPLSTISDPRVKEALSAAVERWAAQWFESGPCMVSDFQLQDRRSVHPGRDLGWRDFGQGVCLMWGDAKALEWAREAIDAPVDASLTAEDSRLLARLAERMARELADDLGTALRLDGSQREEAAMDGAWLEMTLVRTRGKKISLRVSIAAEVLVRFRKRLVGSKPTGSLPDGTLEAAIATRTVRYDAVLGRSRMKAAELCALAPGDVIVLERALSEPLDIVSSGGGAIFGKAMLGQPDGDVRLTMVQA